MSNRSTKHSKSNRLRFGQACQNCRRKKNRCDGVKPVCSGCRSREMACEYAEADVFPFFFEQFDQNGRLDYQAPSVATQSGNHNDFIVGNLLSEATDDQRTIPSSGVDSIAIAADKDAGTMSLLSNTRSHFSTDAHASLSGFGGYFEKTSGTHMISEPAGLGQTHNPGEPSVMETSPSSNVSSLTSSLHSLASAKKVDFNVLPSRELANKLIDAYFERVHVLYPFLHEGTFRAHYEQLWTKNAEKGKNGSSWYALVNLVFAYGCEFVDSGGHDQSLGQAPQFVERATTIILAREFGNADLWLVQSLLLLGHYLSGTLELEKCWSFVSLMVSNAVSIGVHINTADDDQLNPVQRELRKRVWWGCVVLDRTLSMKLGRPTTIATADARAVDLPAEIDDQYIGEHTAEPRQPSGRPSRTSFFVQTIKLSEIIQASISTLYSSERMMSIESLDITAPADEAIILGNVVLLSGQLQAWWRDLPVHLKQEPEQADSIDFQRQRIVMKIRYLQVQLLFQRPGLLLLYNDKPKDDFLIATAIASTNACIRAAEQMIKLIDANYHRKMLNSLWYNLYYIFASVGVLATVQMMDDAHRSKLVIIDQSVMTSGMQFLKNAVGSSALASRYLCLLDRLKSNAVHKAPVAALSGQTRNTTADEGLDASLLSVEPFLQQNLRHQDYISYKQPWEGEGARNDASDSFMLFDSPNALASTCLPTVWGQRSVDIDRQL